MDERTKRMHRDLDAAQRGSGRSTRMLEEAILQAQTGRCVLLFFASAVARDIWKDIIEMTEPAQGLDIQCHHAKVHRESGALCMEIHQASTPCLILVDHAVIESPWAMESTNG